MFCIIRSSVEIDFDSVLLSMIVRPLTLVVTI